MQLHLEGSTTINARREVVFGRVTDPGFLAKTLPEAEDVHVLDAESLEARIKVKIAVVSSSLKLKMTVTHKDSPSGATLLAEGSGGGSTIRIVSRFTMTGDSPTTMSWSADADITGVMSGLGSTLLKSFAAKKVDEIFGGIATAIERNSG